MITQTMPHLSLVVTSFSLERLNDISDLLTSVSNQTFADFEVVIVLEGSKLFEQVKKLVSERKMRDVSVLINEGKKGLSEGRNLGITHSKGEIIAFADDDVVLAPNWAEELLQTFSDKSIVAVTGSAYPLWDDPSKSWLPTELDWLLSCTGWCDRLHWAEMRQIRNVWGMNMAFRREAFDTCGLFPTIFGYHRGAMGEDLGFSMMVRKRTRKRIVFNRKVQVLHKVHGYRLSWGFMAERSFWIGRSKRMLERQYSSSMDEDLLSSEKDLLVQIAIQMPRILKNLRKASVTIIVLLFVGLGFLLPGIPMPRKTSKELEA